MLPQSGYVHCEACRGIRVREARQAAISLGALLAAVSMAGCSGSDGGPAPVTLESVTVLPTSVTLASGASQAFTATAHMSDGGTPAAAVSWSATGGSISGAGVYTAGSSPGEYIVVATAQGSALADTALVVIPAPPPPNLVAIEVAPPAATVQAGLTQQFAAVGRLSDNSTQAVGVSWSATGGVVSAGGIFTAGATPGSYLVIASEIGGPLADTAVVTVIAPPNDIVAIAISPDSVRIIPYDSTQVSAVGRRGDGSTAPVSVTWTSIAGSVTSLGYFKASPVLLGRYALVATISGGTLADTIPVTLHVSTGESVIGPNFWTPTPGAVHLCTSNHFTDDPVGLTATATITATPNIGVLTASKPYATQGWGSYSPFPDGTTIGFVRVACEKVFELPLGYTDSVKVRISVSSYSAGSGMAKIFKYENRNNPQGRADFTPPNQDWPPPNWTTTPVAESAYVSPTNGANIWFKNTKVPF